MYQDKKSHPSIDYSKSIDHIRKANPKVNLKLSKIKNNDGKYNVITLDKD